MPTSSLPGPGAVTSLDTDGVRCEVVDGVDPRPGATSTRRSSPRPRSGVQALHAYDYRDPEGSVQRKLAVLTGELREQYETDLSQGGLLDTYEQVSATTSYEVVDVGLQRINEAQDTVTLVVFGQYVRGRPPPPVSSRPPRLGVEVSCEHAQSCTGTVQVAVVRVDGEWKIDELTLPTTG